MTAVARIVERAFREINIVANTQNPTPMQAGEAVELLGEVVASVYGFEAGERLWPLPYGQNNIQSPQGFPFSQFPPGEWWLPLNARLMLNLQEAFTFDLNPMPEDGSRFGIIDESDNLATYNVTVRGNGRRIEGATQLVISQDGFNAEWFYRADLGEWKRVTPLTAADEFPFPPEFDTWFITLLAMRLSPRYGANLTDATTVAMQRWQRLFKARYRQTIQKPSPLGLVRRSTQAYSDWNNQDGIGSQPGTGNTGWAWPGYPGMWP